MYVYIYISLYIYAYIYTYMYIYNRTPCDAPCGEVGSRAESSSGVVAVGRSLNHACDAAVLASSRR